jgi:hypothetical protein
MQCQNCQLENPEAATHCALCRQPLAATQHERADGIWLIPPAPATSATCVGAAALAAEQARQQAAKAPDHKMAGQKADKWLPRLVFFLGIFIVGVGLGVSGGNWLKLTDHAAAAADEKTPETPPAGHKQPTPADKALNAPPHTGRRTAQQDDSMAGSAAASTPRQQPVAVPAPAPAPEPAPVPAPAPAAVAPAAAESAAPPAAVSPKPAAKRRSVAKLNKPEPLRSPLAATTPLQKQPAKRPHRSGRHRKPASRPDQPPATALQMAEMKAGSKRTQLNQCENRVSWIEREKCRWQLCSNQWGQHGCPAYPSPLNQQ